MVESLSIARIPDGTPPAAEYEQLRQMKLGHNKDDIRLRIRRSHLRVLSYRCPYCGADPWAWCHVRGTGGRVSQTHSARNWLAIDEIRRGAE